jgi:hypothetical protein
MNNQTAKIIQFKIWRISTLEGNIIIDPNQRKKADQDHKSLCKNRENQKIRLQKNKLRNYKEIKIKCT